MKKIAILYQNELPPQKDGIQKPMKPGGYADSGADIGYCLRSNGIEIVTPNSKPNPKNDYDWAFPDSVDGIEDALNKGTNIFWLNTVLYKNHPIESYFEEDIEIIGQHPEMVDVYDDKIVTNRILFENRLSIPKSFIVEYGEELNFLEKELLYPMVVKPRRGRGSQGVSIAKNKQELSTKTNLLFDSNVYGSSIYVEQFLSGKEITITVMPPGFYNIDRKEKKPENYWSCSLPRFRTTVKSTFLSIFHCY